MTYSFPCTDLSIAGQGLARKDGLKKGSATRSGLLWEVERLLNELGTELPQILLMENVPQVATTEGFADWCNFLKSKGYINHWQILNAKNYGVAQNRERCFMISILSPDYVDFTFPSPVKLEKTVRDYLEPTVDEKYYINTEKAQKLLFELSDTIIAEQNRTEQNRLFQCGIDLSTNSSGLKDIANCITVRYDAGICKHKDERTGVIEINSCKAEQTI